jgi:hypothetical protein
MTNKAILVIDMPETCGDCPLCVGDEYDLVHECCLKYKGYVEAKDKPDWYSLREIPEKYDTERPYILDFNEDCKRGYNSCIEEILARGIKHD